MLWGDAGKIVVHRGRGKGFFPGGQSAGMGKVGFDGGLKFGTKFDKDLGDLWGLETTHHPVFLRRKEAC